MEARTTEYIQKWLRGLNDVKVRDRKHDNGDTRRYIGKMQ